MRPLFVAVAVALALAACGSAQQAPKEGGIKDVVVVFTNASKPLPFDPRGGRITIVTQEIARLVGHPIVLELDTALSPEFTASLEETVLASFENIARELTLLQRDDPDMFARAKSIDRVVCRYDAVAKESAATLAGHIVTVKSPPDEWPLLERGLFTEAVYRTFIADLEKRFGDRDPTSLRESEEGPWFEYMMATRAGAGYLWVAARAHKGGDWNELRAQHLERIVAFANAAHPPTAKKARHWLVEEAPYAGSLKRGKVFDAYDAWLAKNIGQLDDKDRGKLASSLFEHRSGICGGSDCEGDLVPSRVDRFAFGMTFYDAWVKDGAKPNPPEPYKSVVCPMPRHGEAETEILWSCSRFFEMTMHVDEMRAALARRLDERKEERLLDQALLNLGRSDAEKGLAFVEGLADERLRRHGEQVLFFDHARRDDVRRVLEERAPALWRDQPNRRAFPLLVLGRKYEGYDITYSDDQWKRFTGEFGGPIAAPLLSSFLAQGPRAIEMTPKMWPALARTKERDDLVANSLPTLFARDHESRSARARPALLLLRKRYCDEKNASGMAGVRASVGSYVKAHPDESATYANTLADFELGRCAKPSAE